MPQAALDFRNAQAETDHCSVVANLDLDLDLAARPNLEEPLLARKEETFDLIMEKSRAQTLTLLSCRKSLSACHEVEAWGEEVTNLLSCVSSADRALLLERQEKTKIQEENEALIKANDGLTEQLSTLQRDKAAAEDAQLKLKQENELLAKKLASTCTTDDQVDGEDEVSALRRRVTYWRERDKSAAARREQELEAERARDADRYKKVALLEKKLKDAEHDALTWKRRVQDEKMRHGQELESVRAEYDGLLVKAREDGEACVLACRKAMEAEAREQQRLADAAIRHERDKLRWGIRPHGIEIIFFVPAACVHVEIDDVEYSCWRANAHADACGTAAGSAELSNDITITTRSRKRAPSRPCIPSLAVRPCASVRLCTQAPQNPLVSLLTKKLP